MKTYSDIRVGYYMDLENDSAAHAIMTDIDKQAAEFEYFRVCDVVPNGDTVLIGWEGIGGLVAYPVDKPFEDA